MIATRCPAPVAALLAVLALLAGALASPALADADAITLSSDEMKRLETFEAHALSKADKAFADKQYKQAAAEYDAFVLDFVESSAVPYALLRKGLSRHRDNRRFEAIRDYQEVLDYFPNEVKYAAAAQYYIGLAHHQNSDDDKALAAWASMARDKEYRKHPLAADALMRLADALMQRNEPEKAVNYYKQIAVDFRTRNDDAANQAINKVEYHYIRRNPDEASLREFYKEVRTFDRRPRDLPEDLEGDGKYWNTVRDLVRRHDRFGNDEADQRKEYFRYWAGAIGNRRPADDTLRIEVANFQRLADGDAKAWIATLDKQFESHQEDGDFDRIVRWIGLFGEFPEKVDEYYKKINFEAMKNGAIIELMKVAFDNLKQPELAKNVYRQIRFDDLDDDARLDVASYLRVKDEALFIETCLRLSDKNRGKYAILQHFVRERNAEKGLPYAEELTNVADYASNAWYYRGYLLEVSKKYDEAIAAYRQTSRSPENFWRIAECYRDSNRLEQAIAQLREIENFYEKESAKAALRVAHYYRDAKKKKQHVAALRQVLHKYPGTGQATSAHNDLEEMGYKVAGGIDAE